ncbi:MAG: peptidase, family M23/M37 protein [uncultured bacterium]|nr:MAG: peptidase, family M23/M37 protein [uncultured bacterium]
MTQTLTQSIGQMPSAWGDKLGNDTDTLKKASTDFEAFFMGQVMEEAHKAIPKSDLMGDSMGLDLYQSLFIQETVKQACATGRGFGLSKYFTEKRHATPAINDLKKLSDAKSNPSLPVKEFIVASPLPSLDISSAFGIRRDPFKHKLKHHDGIDLKGKQGTPIEAAADGKVSYSGVMKGYGNVVILDHGNGYETLYAHNQKNDVTVGESIKQGQVIGNIGKTGKATGPHLHFEVRKDGAKINPVTVFNFVRNV